MFHRLEVLSVFSFNIAASLIEDCGGSSRIPVDRAGGVKIKAFRGTN